MMKYACGFLLLGLAATMAQAAITIDFDAASDQSALGSQFASLGIVETDAGPYVTDSFASFPGVTIPSGNQMLGLRTSDGFAEIKFVSLIDSSVDAYVTQFKFSRPGDNGSGFYEGMLVEAVNVSGIVVDSVIAPPFGPGGSVQVIEYTLAAPDIHRVRFTFINNAIGEGGNAVDDFVFPQPTAIPEPASLALLALGGLTLLLRR